MLGRLVWNMRAFQLSPHSSSLGLLAKALKAIKDLKYWGNLIMVAALIYVSTPIGTFPSLSSVNSSNISL
jgi:hypothetical protein